MKVTEKLIEPYARAHNRLATTHLRDRLAPMVQIERNAPSGAGRQSLNVSREARPIEYIEILEDQQSDRLAEIEYAYAPERLVTDDLRSYGAAARDLAPRASIETRR
jgi:hypothetical protein